MWWINVVYLYCLFYPDVTRTSLTSTCLLNSYLSKILNLAFSLPILSVYLPTVSVLMCCKCLEIFCYKPFFTKHSYEAIDVNSKSFLDKTACEVWKHLFNHIRREKIWLCVLLFLGLTTRCLRQMSELYTNLPFYHWHDFKFDNVILAGICLLYDTMHFTLWSYTFDFDVLHLYQHWN